MKGTLLSVAAALLTAGIGLSGLANAGPRIPGYSITGALSVMTAKCKEPQCNPKAPHCNKPGCQPGCCH